MKTFLNPGSIQPMIVSRLLFRSLLAFGLCIALLAVCLPAQASSITVFDDDFENRTAGDQITFAELNANVSTGSYRTFQLGGSANRTYKADAGASNNGALFDGLNNGGLVAAQLDVNNDGNGGGGTNAGDTVSFTGGNSISASWEWHKRRTGGGKEYTATFQQVDPNSVNIPVLQLKWQNSGQVNALIYDPNATDNLIFAANVYEETNYTDESQANFSDVWIPHDPNAGDGAWSFSVDFSQDLAVVQVIDDEGNTDGAFNIDLSGLSIAQEFEQLEFRTPSASGLKGFYLDNILITAQIIPEPASMMLLMSSLLWMAGRKRTA